MKLSQVLKDWPEETKLYYEILGKLPSGKHREGPDKCDEEIADFLSKIPTSCDREINREALAKELCEIKFYTNNSMDWDDLSENRKYLYLKKADHIISTMPTWLKRSEG